MGSTCCSRDGPAKKKRRTVQKVVRAACLECRRRKLACDAGRPRCARCAKQRRQVECRYDTENDAETHTMALKREVESLRATLDHVAASFAALRELPEGASARLLLDVAAASDSVAELVHTGRRIQSQRDVLNRRISELEAAKAVFPSPRSGLEFELNMLHPHAYPVFFCPTQRPDEHRAALAPLAGMSSIPPHGALLPHRPTLLAGAAPRPLTRSSIRFWTRVPIDPDLACTAIATYLATDHALQGHFDLELFLDDLISCRPSRFCSSLLLNSLLSYCCLKLTAYEKHAAVLGAAFQKESETLWTSDKTPCATSLSALCFLLASSVHGGRLAEGVGYLHEAVVMGRALGVWGGSTKSGSSPCHEHDLDNRALAFAAWAAYAHIVHWIFRRWDRLPPSPPCLPLPAFSQSTPAGISSSFGMTPKAARKAHQTFTALCNVLPVMRDAMVVFHANIRNGTSFSLSFAESIYKRMLDCHDRDSADLMDDPESPGYVTILRMWYHMTVMDLFQPFVKRQQTLRGFSASDSSPRGLYLASLRHLQHLVFLFRNHSPLAMATPLWHGCVFFLAKAVTMVSPRRESRGIFRLCIVTYTDLLVSFPGLLDVFRAMLLMGLHVGFITTHESAGLVEGVQKRRDSQQAAKADDLTALADLTLNIACEDTARPQVKVEQSAQTPSTPRGQHIVVQALSLAVQSANFGASGRAPAEIETATASRPDHVDKQPDDYPS